MQSEELGTECPQVEIATKMTTLIEKVKSSFASEAKKFCYDAVTTTQKCVGNLRVLIGKVDAQAWVCCTANAITCRFSQ